MKKKNLNLPLSDLFFFPALLILFLTSLYSYILFHSFAEVFSIIVAFSTFMVVWNVRDSIANKYILFIGTAYFFIGTLDLFHAFAFPEMNIFRGHGTNLFIQLWISARYIQSISFCFAPLLFKRNLNFNIIIGTYIAVFFLILLSIFYWNIFPTCYIEGYGLTLFKIISEYIIIFIFLLAIVFTLKHRDNFDKKTLKLLILSMIFMIISEVAFIFCISIQDFCDMVGHFSEILAFYLLYKVIIETGITEPYSLLFNDLKQTEKELKHANQLLKTQATTDDLTGVHNRRWLYEVLGLEIKRAQRYNLPLTIIIFDIDYFKNINDQYGHNMGDNLLQEIAGLVNKNIRSTDFFARLGGDEFLILMPGHSWETAGQFIEKLRMIIEKYNFTFNKNVTCSFGITQFKNDDTINKLLKRADEGLYWSKNNGRNMLKVVL
ncbi:MAG: GGDEF domain-containing protein [bacterium]|nr:GGDEF domain-containing protein [bacterium]